MTKELSRGHVCYNLEWIHVDEDHIGKHLDEIKDKQVEYLTKIYLKRAISRPNLITYLQIIGLDNFQIIKLLKEVVPAKKTIDIY